GQHRESLEVRQLRAVLGLELSVDDVEIGGDLVIDAHEGRDVDRGPVDRDPFGHRMHVRAGEPTDPQIVGGDERVEHPGRGGLPIRSRHRDRRSRRVDVAEDLAGSSGRVEAQLDLGLPRPGEQQGVDPRHLGLRGLPRGRAGAGLISFAATVRRFGAHARLTARRVPSGSSSGSKTCAAPSAEPNSSEVARVSPAMSSLWVSSAAVTSALASTMTAIRSEMCRSSRLRMPWMARTASRAMPSASSSGLTRVSRARKPESRAANSMPSVPDSATDSKEYSPSTSSMPPLTTVPSVTDQ